MRYADDKEEESVEEKVDTIADGAQESADADATDNDDDE